MRRARALGAVLTALGLAVAASPCAAQGEPRSNDFDEVALNGGVSVGFGMLLLGDTAEPPPGLHGYVLARPTTVTRLILDEATGATFGYRLDVSPIASFSSPTFVVRVDIRPLEAAEEKALKRIQVCPGCPAPRLVAMPVRFPPSQIVRDGDTIVVDMLVRPSTREKIVDVVKFSSDQVTRALIDEIRARVGEASRHLRRGDDLLARGEITAAATEYSRSIDLQPDATAHLRLARSQQRLGRLLLAQRQYERALALNREDADAWHELAMLLHRAGGSSQATSRYRHALKLRPDWALARRNLATAYLDTGELAPAFEEYRQSRRSDPGILQSKDAACVPPMNAAMQYYLFAKVHAAESEWDATVIWLKKAKEAGFNEFKRLQSEPEFKPLLHDPRLVALLPRQSRS
jgi:Tfp pilus assembly protein PilF